MYARVYAIYQYDSKNDKKRTNYYKLLKKHFEIVPDYLAVIYPKNPIRSTKIS